MGAKPGFTRLSPTATGITFGNELPDVFAEQNRILENGSGVALGDVDADGHVDVYFCRLNGPNVLYRNLGAWRFEDITTRAGVACAGQISTGASFADVDGDRDLDLLVNALGGGTRLFRNDGRGQFAEDAAAGLNRTSAATSLALADIDGDGDLDLYVTHYRTSTVRDVPPADFRVSMVNGRRVVEPADRFRIAPRGPGADDYLIVEMGEPDILYLNDGAGRFGRASWTDGRFLDAEGKPLMDPPRGWGLSVMLRDFNGDGAPDIYVCNDFADATDDFWLNDGRGHFRAAPRLTLRNNSWSSMTVDAADIDRDGHVDFFVADMLARDHRRWHTQRASADLAAMSVRIGDIDNVPQNPRNTLFLARGDGTFAEIAQLAGVQASDWSWSAAFLDVDLDGFEDLLITTGNGHDIRDADTSTRANALTQGKPRGDRPRTLLMYPKLASAKVLFRNRGDLTFEEVGAAWGFNDIGVAQGMAFADLDGDGDLDVVVNQLNDLARVYRNDSPGPRLAVRLRGAPPNTQGIGARIQVFGGPVVQSQEMICGGRYLSGDESMRVFAAGAATNRLRVEATWRSGVRSVLEGVPANSICEISESAGVGSSEFKVQSSRSADTAGNAGLLPVKDGSVLRQAGSVEHRSAVVTNLALMPSRDRRSNSPLNESANRKSETHRPQVGASGVGPSASKAAFFRDVSALLDHSHFELPFDDFGRQLLLPHRLSQLGPGVAWVDLDGDGWEDLIVGSGRGGGPSVLLNQAGAAFKSAKYRSDFPRATGDLTTILGLAEPGHPPRLLIGVSNNESTNSLREASAMQFELKSGFVEPVSEWSGQTASVGPMALADLDGDGDLDLFVGGRMNPGRYPEPATSRIYRNDRGAFRLDRARSEPFVEIGLVSGAVFSDLDADGDPDLVLACEYGPVRMFRNDAGHFRENTAELGLAKFLGRWNGVATGDFDGDGRMDIIASNWGRNTKYQRTLDTPLRTLFGDLDHNGTLDIVETYLDPGSKRHVPWRGRLSVSRAMPFIAERMPTFAAYAAAGVEEIFGETLTGARELIVTTLDTMLFLNRGDHFEPRPLPIAAQFAPAFGISVGDLDGDGREDIFLAQNFFAVHPETSRYDGGRGLWLRGRGDGSFEAVPGQESGVLAYGEQRGCALADLDHDGRVDLVITQNGAATKLFRGERARPGLRVEFRPGANTASAIGATLRVRSGDRLGPAREVHAGAGYWSQDATTQILGLSDQATGLWIRWPGGTVQEIRSKDWKPGQTVAVSRKVELNRP